MHKIMPEFYPTPNCTCGKGRQTIRHYLLHCELYNIERISLFNAIESIFIKHNVSPKLCNIDVPVLIGNPSELSSGIITQIRKEVVTYIRATDVNI